MDAVTPYPDPVGLCRAIRRRADTSQREIARRAGLSRSTIARIEAGRLTPSLEVLGRLLAVAGFALVAVDPDGRVVVPMTDPPGEKLRDGGEKRYPAHLDTVVEPRPDEWWGSVYGLARPPETAHRSRALRDAARRRSQWETRVKQFRHVPPPPRVQALLQWPRTPPDPAPPPSGPGAGSPTPGPGPPRPADQAAAAGCRSRRSARTISTAGTSTS